ncbi:MAG: leucine-rich repeat domain-containing protein [SAR202 cluster bacterium]|nr:leucine-rich repeat domain-containing protein [SAR202 cluster bacterium]
MTKTELKKNITKINKLLRSDSYEAGIELIKTLDDPEIKKGTLKEVLKHPDYYEAGIKSVKTLDVSVIDEGIIKLLLKQQDYDAIDTGIELARALDEPAIFEALLGGWSINDEGKLVLEEGYKGETLTKRWADESWSYVSYALWNLISYSPDNVNINETIKRENILKANILIISAPRVTDGNFVSYLNLLSKFKQLKSLIIDGDYRIVPEEIENLTQIKSLILKSEYLYNVGVDDINDLPFSNLLNLEELEVSSIRSSGNMKKLISISKLLNLKKLILSKLQIPEIPNQFAELINIKELDLSNNSLEDEDRITTWGGPNNDKYTIHHKDSIKSLAKLINLEKLNLKSNNLTKVKWVGNLKNLEYLNLESNELTEIPSEIGKLKKLKVLKIAFNKINSISVELGRLEKLEELDISMNNELTSLPDEIVNLEQLKILNLKANKLTDLPSNLNLLKKLKYLDVSRNSFNYGKYEGSNFKVSDGDGLKEMLEKILPDTEIIFW